MPRSKCSPGTYFWLFYILILSLFSLWTLVDGIHVQGIWSPSTTLFKVITRFGFQRTDQNHRLETSGYMFGNITLLNHQSSSSSRKILLNKNNNNHSTILDSSNPYFNSGILLFANRTLFKHIYQLYKKTKNVHMNCNQTDDDLGGKFCADIFKAIHPKNTEKICHNSSNDDNDDDDEYFRYVPCPTGGTCDNQCQEMNIPNYQLTYVIDEQKDASFWYLLLLPCRRKFLNQTSFIWTRKSNTKTLLSYDLWIVNGHPNNRLTTRLIDSDYQFSYEQQNFWFYILLDFGYIILFLMQIYLLSMQKKMKNLNYLFTISLLLHSLSYFFICLHKIVFAQNGKGLETLFIIAEVMKIMSIALLILFVLVIAKGWPFTKPETFSKTLMIIMATIYIVINILLFIWMKNSLNMIEEVDEFHTVPGWISLGFRIVLMLWFIYELRHTMMLEQDSRRLKFYLHFGAGMLVWFVHLPLVAMVAIHIDLMWRCKIITGFSSTADFLAFAILTRIMWTTNNKQFLIPDNHIYNEELEYYDDDDSSFVVHQSETYKFSNANHHLKNSSSKHFQYDNHHAVCDNNTTITSTTTTTITPTPITTATITTTTIRA
ncbi:hypothetical protein DERF_013778 [Dermatophagoides farinae]|uniref:GPR180/TMEM145 transmembrane domain-containing protein n=1 Tax=Dermatophagoides farinae TaxID=6954 RepID=A0A922L0W9_DERFA|nr:hypothetical protein DERF_013778 [Dermatophagoides farinae]